jgi:diguanylate cyclase (GGDEF)-like protein
MTMPRVRRRGPATFLVLACLAVVIDSWFLHGRTGSVVYDVIGGASVLVAVAGALRKPKGSRLAWFLLAAGFGGWVGGDIIWNAYALSGSASPPVPSWPDWLYFAGYPVAAVGLALATRARSKGAAHATGDAAIIALGCGVFVWQFVIDPIIDDPSSDLLPRVITGSYPALDILLLFLLVRSLLTGSTRERVLVPLGVGLVTTMLADIGYAAGLDLGGVMGPLMSAGWLLGYVLLGSAAWSRETLGTPHVDASAGGRTRLVALALAGLVAPATWILADALDQHLDVPLVASAAGLIFVLAVSRMSRVVASLQQALSVESALVGELAHLAMHDPLTGLPHRSVLLESLEQPVADPAIDVRWAALVDLDGFKAVNDGAGHRVGDEVLKGVAARLQATLRPEDTVARLGGDEFGISASLAAEVAQDLGERILAVFRQPFPTSAGNMHVHASVGLAPARGESAEQLIADADAAMYAVKHQGKNRAAVFDPSMQSGTARRLEVLGALESALDADALEVHY